LFEKLAPETGETVQSFTLRWRNQVQKLLKFDIVDLSILRMTTQIGLQPGDKVAVRNAYEKKLADDGVATLPPAEKMNWYSQYLNETFGSTEISSNDLSSAKNPEIPNNPVNMVQFPSELNVWTQELNGAETFFTKINGTKTEIQKVPETSNVYYMNYEFKAKGKGRGKGKGAKGKGKGKGKGKNNNNNRYQWNPNKTWHNPCTHCGKTNHASDTCWNKKPQQGGTVQLSQQQWENDWSS